MTRPKFTSSAAVAIPDPRVSAQYGPMVLVSIHTDQHGDVWHCYPDGWIKLDRPVVSKPPPKPAVTAVKPRPKPRR